MMKNIKLLNKFEQVSVNIWKKCKYSEIKKTIFQVNLSVQHQYLRNDINNTVIVMNMQKEGFITLLELPNDQKMNK